MIKLHIRNRNALACLCLHCFAQSRGRDLLQRGIERVCLCSWSSRDDHLPAALDEPRQSISQLWTSRTTVVQNDQCVIENAGRIDRTGALEREGKRQILVCCQRALQVQAVAATARSTLNNQRLRG